MTERNLAITTTPTLWSDSQAMLVSANHKGIIVLKIVPGTATYQAHLLLDETLLIPLPSAIGSSGQFSDTCALLFVDVQRPSEAVLFYAMLVPSGGVKLFRYTLALDVLTLTASVSLGDINSVPQVLLLLPNGNIAVLWSQQFVPSGTVGIGVAYLSSAGALLQQQFPLTAPSDATGRGTKVVAAVHPADGALRAFAKGDAANHIASWRFVVGSGGLQLESASPRFISWDSRIVPTTYPKQYVCSGGDGKFGPEGEFPTLVAIPDRVHNVIKLAYQSANSVMYQGQPSWVKAVEIAICSIQANGAKSFRLGPAKTERLTGFGFSIDANGHNWLAQTDVIASPPALDPTLKAWRDDGTQWRLEGILGTVLGLTPKAASNFTNDNINSAGGYRFRPDRPEFVALMLDAAAPAFNGVLRRYAFDVVTAPVPTPPPPPDPTPEPTPTPIPTPTPTPTKPRKGKGRRFTLTC